MFVFVPPPPPSKRAQELGQKMAELIRIFKDNVPDLNALDVRHAMQIAQVQTQKEMGGLGAGLRAIVFLIMGLFLAFGLGIFFFMQRSGRGLGAATPMILIAVLGFLAVVVGLVFVIRQKGGG